MMTPHLTEIWRHPIKSLGRETLDRVTLEPGRWLYGDRLWAVTHAKSEIDGTGWAHCRNFLRCTHGPDLMAVTCTFDPDTGRIVLHHPRTPPLEFAPNEPDDHAKLIAWLAQIWPPEMPAPTGLYSYDDGNLTDSSKPLVSLFNTASHRAVEDRVGKPLSHLRWRGNLWIDGLGPWQEFEWIDKEIRIGDTVLRVEKRITRCRAIMANPETGQRDADVLEALDTWGHRDFGVLARVIQGGEISVGQSVEVRP